MSMRFNEIGQQLRAYRLESGLRAEEIAARLGVSRAELDHSAMVLAIEGLGNCSLRGKA